MFVVVGDEYRKPAKTLSRKTRLMYIVRHTGAIRVLYICIQGGGGVIRHCRRPPGGIGEGGFIATIFLASSSSPPAGKHVFGNKSTLRRTALVGEGGGLKNHPKSGTDAPRL